MTLFTFDADTLVRVCWLIATVAGCAALYLTIRQSDRRQLSAARQRARASATTDAIDPKVLARMRAVAASVPREAAEPRPRGAVRSVPHQAKNHKRPA